MSLFVRVIRAPRVGVILPFLVHREFYLGKMIISFWRISHVTMDLIADV